jgi:hypothetical protein
MTGDVNNTHFLYLYVVGFHCILSSDSTVTHLTWLFHLWNVPVKDSDL